MDIVMVPVPEEHVAAVEQYLRWNIGSLPPGVWEPEVVEGFLAGLDEPARALLLRAAEAAHDVAVLTVVDAAAAIGCNEREVVGILMELNYLAASSGGPAFLMATDTIAGTSETGPRAWKLNMPGEVAELILATSGRGVPVDE